MNDKLKGLSQVIQKPVKDWTENDLLKIVQSQELKEKLINIEIVEAILENCNENLKEILNPIYFQLSLNERLNFMESKLRELEEEKDNNKKTELMLLIKELLEEDLNKNDSVINVLISSLLGLTLFEDFDVEKYEENIKNGLITVENLLLNFDIKEHFNLILNILEIVYFPLVSNYAGKYSKTLLEENEEFKEFIEEFSKFQLNIIEDLKKEEGLFDEDKEN